MHDHHRIRPVRNVGGGPLCWNHVVHLHSEALRIGRVESHPPTPTAAVLTFQLEGGVGSAASGQHRGRVMLDASDAESLRMQMENVIPSEQATADIPDGPYPVMVMHTRRA